MDYKEFTDKHQALWPKVSHKSGTPQSLRVATCYNSLAILFPEKFASAMAWDETGVSLIPNPYRKVQKAVTQDKPSPAGESRQAIENNPSEDGQGDE